MSRLRWFEGYGIEIEYMIVAADTLDIVPIADKVLAAAAGGEPVNEVEHGRTAWSNELALHLIELKTNGPARTLDGLDRLFQQDVGEINDLLRAHGARLLPGAMHPWMDPDTETRLWPYGYNPIYEAYDRIFSCRGHGWSNLQSLQINLPFGDDDEFGRLHAAIRVALPILPALAASSPLVEGRPSGFMDTRMEYYRANSARIPSITGAVIPEPVFTESDYREKIFLRMYRDVAPLDPLGLLREEWLNSRGAIARFDRNAFEIRIIDSQECPLADMAVAQAVCALVRALGEEAWCDRSALERFAVEPLAYMLELCNRDAEAAVIEDRAFLEALGYTRGSSCRADRLWAHIIDRLSARQGFPAGIERVLETILSEGSLARRIVNMLPAPINRQAQRTLYERLATCLATGTVFSARA